MYIVYVFVLLWIMKYRFHYTDISDNVYHFSIQKILEKGFDVKYRMNDSEKRVKDN